MPLHVFILLIVRLFSNTSGSVSRQAVCWFLKIRCELYLLQVSSREAQAMKIENGGRLLRDVGTNACGRGGGRVGQREKLGCSVATGKASGEPVGSL